MADTAVETPAPATPAKEKAAKKTKAAGTKKPAKKATHPATSEMVNKAIANLKEKKGSSLQAIKKYIVANYKVDADRLAPFVKKYLINAVETGALLRTKGKGAAGSFKLDDKKSGGANKVKKTTKATAAKKTGVKAGRVEKKKPAAKKAAAPKKAVPAKKAKAPATPKKAAAPKPKKTPTKAKKAAKPPTKPKTPKAKKAGGTRGRPAGKKTPAKK